MTEAERDLLLTTARILRAHLKDARQQAADDRTYKELGDDIFLLNDLLIPFDPAPGDAIDEQVQSKGNRGVAALSDVRTEGDQQCLTLPPVTHAKIRRLKEIIDIRMNNHLVEMKPDYDDSIIGFNEAWGVVSEAFNDFPAPASPWRPLETAPKDGAPILLCRDDDKKIAGYQRNYTVEGLCDQHAIGFWLHRGWKSLEIEDCGSMGGEYTGWMPDWVSLDLEPTHWMPLPAPPSTSNREEE